MPDATPPPPASDETRRDAVCAWLRANGINPAHVPRDADIHIGVNPAGRYLDCEIFDNGPHANENGQTARLVIRVPLKVEPPSWWEPHAKPTRDDLLHLVGQLEKLTTQGPPGTPGPPGDEMPGGYDFGWDAAMTTIRATLKEHL